MIVPLPGRPGGVGGIRTLGTLLEYTPLAGARLQPLGHHSFRSRAGTSELGPTPLFPFLAEEEGFEPSEALTSTVFKTAAFNHSATPPWSQLVRDASCQTAGSGA